MHRTPGKRSTRKTCSKCGLNKEIAHSRSRPDGVHYLPTCNGCYRTPEQAREERYAKQRQFRAELAHDGLFDCSQCKRILPEENRVKGGAFVCKKCASENSSKRYHGWPVKRRREYRRKCWSVMISNPETRLRYALRKRMASFMYRVLWGQARRSSARVIEYLGCTPQQFRQYIEAQFVRGMPWDNHGAWEIDHVMPLSAFDIKDEGQIKKAWHYTNMRPLWKNENRSKAAKKPSAHQPCLLLTVAP